MKLFFVIEENYEWDTDKITLERFPPLEKKKKKNNDKLFSRGPPSFSKNSQKFATSPSPAIGCYWLYKKLYKKANRSDCTLALR